MSTTICFLIDGEFNQTRRIQKDTLRDLLLEVLSGKLTLVSRDRIETDKGKIVFESSEPHGMGGRGIQYVYHVVPHRG